MCLVKVAVVRAEADGCPINRKDCVRCRYNMSIGLFTFSKSVYVLCGYERGDSEAEEPRLSECVPVSVQ